MRSAIFALVVTVALAGAALRECEDLRGTIRLLVIIDREAPVASLASQHIKIEKILRHVEARGAGQPHVYGLITAGRDSVETLAALDDPSTSRSADAIIKRLMRLQTDKSHSTDNENPENNTMARTAAALRTAVANFAAATPSCAGGDVNIALLALDFFHPTLQPTLQELSSWAKLFVIGNENANIVTSPLWSIERRRVYAAPGDITEFFNILNKEIDEAREKQHQSIGADNGVKKSDENAGKCAKRRVDLIVALDTSGSTGGAAKFARERQLAVELINALDDRAFVDGRLQLSVLRFSVDQMLVLPLLGGRPKALTLAALRAVPFTGRVTRIADALDAAADTLRRNGRQDAMQVLVLISDGRGQESWSDATEAGRRVRINGTLVFAASANADASAAELALYAGPAADHVFVSANARKNFVRRLAARLNSCMAVGDTVVVSAVGGESNASAELDSDAFEAKMRAKSTFVDAADPFQAPAISSGGIFDADSATPITDSFSSTVTGTTVVEQTVTNIVDTVASSNGAEDSTVTIKSPEHVTVTTDTQTATVTPSNLTLENTDAATIFSIGGHAFYRITDASPFASFSAATISAATVSTSVTQSVDTTNATISNKKAAGITVTDDIEAETTNEAIVKSLEFLRNDSNPQATTVAEATVVKESTHVFRWPAAQNDFSFDDAEQQQKKQQEEVEQQKVKKQQSERQQNETTAEDSIEKIARLSRLLQDHQNLSRLPDDCSTDVLLLVDQTVSASDKSDDFGEQLDTLAALVHRVNAADVAVRRVRFALITFAKTAQLEAGFAKTAGGGRDELVRRLMEIRPAPTGGSSFAAAVRLADQEVAKYRRRSARLFVVVLWSGRNGRDRDRELDEALQTVARWSSSEAYALTLSRAARVDRLVTLAGGDRWRVFVDGRAAQLASRAGDALVTCRLPAADGAVASAAALDAHRPRSDVERVEHLQGAAAALVAGQPAVGCPEDRLDLVLVLDTTPLTVVNTTQRRTAADALRRAALDALRQADSADVGGRVHVGLIRVDALTTASMAFSLREALPLDDALFAVERLALETTADRGRSFDDVLATEVRSVQRADARLAFIVLTELSLTDGGDAAPGRALLRQLARAFRPPLVVERPAILALSPANDIYGELSGRDARFRMYKDRRSGSGYHRFVKETRRQLFACRTTRVDGATDPSVSSDVVLRDDPVHLERRQAPVTLISRTDCLLDLIFVIDTSQSVVDEFQRQIQFAVDLVSRFTDAEFISKVRVAIVAFERTARVERRLTDSHLDKVSVLEALQGLRHTGGSTSVAAGIEVAADEATNRRHDARLTVVLISDGRTQDEWTRATAAADRLRQFEADTTIYAVTVSHEHFFRELELYTGDKSNVYTYERIQQFMDNAHKLLTECTTVRTNNNTTVVPGPTSSTGTSAGSTVLSNSSLLLGDTESAANSSCSEDPVDLLFLLDTSTSVEKEFLAQKDLLVQLVKVLPKNDFENRIRVGLIAFNAQADERLALGGAPTAYDAVLDALTRITHVGGQTSLAAGVTGGLEALRKRRAAARLVVVLVSDGNSQDPWPVVQSAARRLRHAVGSAGTIYAATTSAKYYADELREYAGDSASVYAEAQTADFVRDVGQSIVSCDGTIIPTPDSFSSQAKTKAGSGKFTWHRDAAAVAFSQDAVPAKTPSGKCKYTKMDLIVILDASTSRENVFEQQRELALSLIERLPISQDDTHVATGLNSFTNVPTLRQTLGLGRDRKMVRKAIEDIKYLGGSTLTSKAVELAVHDLERGRRPDAVQVVVLMNDGMSQDQWDKVLSASATLAATGAERFGVALGKDVDLRELRHYIGNEKRIYRDNSTERFLNDVVSLLDGVEKECVELQEVSATNPSTGDDDFEFQTDACAKPQLYVVVLFDQSVRTPNFTDPRLNANRYLLLDVLGSLPLETQVRIGIVEFADRPRLIHRFMDPQDRDSVFERVESIQAIRSRPAYAPAVRAGLDYLTSARQPGARGLLLVVGGGTDAVDSSDDRRAASAALRKTPDIAVHALDSGKDTDVYGLSAYTGSAKRVYDYDRNAEFAKVLAGLATAGSDCGPKFPPKNEEEKERISGGVSQSSSSNSNGETVAALLSAASGARARDIDAVAGDAKLFGGALDDAQKSVRQPISATILPTVAGRTIGRTLSKIRSLEEAQLTTVESARTIMTTLPAENQKIEKTVKGVVSSPTVRTTRATTSVRTIKTTTTLPIVRSTSSRLLARTVGTKDRKSTKVRTLSFLPLSRRRPNPAEQPKPVVKPEKLKTTTVVSTTIARTSTLPTVLDQKKSVALIANDAPRPPPITAPTSDFEADLQQAEQDDTRPFRPGCLVDLLILLDASGSVEPAFQREKALAAGITRLWRIGANNTRIALLKFASAEKVRALHSFADQQSRTAVLRALVEAPFGAGGVTAIHNALQQALAEFSPSRGARSGIAAPALVIVTDGYGQQDVGESARLLRRVVPNVYAVAVVGDQTAINRRGLETIAGDPSRVFTGDQIGELYERLRADFPC